MLEQLREADKKARARFTYKNDKPGVDLWKSFAEKALRGEPWSGDCDDLASTACDIAYRLGVPLKSMWFANVSSKRDMKIDHMVAFAKVDGKLWVIGDTFGPCYLFSQMKHGPTKQVNKFYVANLTNILKWGYLTPDEMIAFK